MLLSFILEIRPVFPTNLPHLLGNSAQQVVQRHCSQIAAFPGSDRNFLLFLLAVAYNQHIRYLLELCVTDLQVHPFAPAVHFNPQAPCLQTGLDRVRIFLVPVGDGNNHRLHRG